MAHYCMLFRVMKPKIKYLGFSKALSLEQVAGYLLVLSYAHFLLMVHGCHWYQLNLNFYHVGLILHRAGNLRT
jgi:G:T-mismatch repair DNA endonuclease (very short patch repair protein)